MIDYVDEENLKLEIKKNKFLLVNFSAGWCGPCKAFAPILEEYHNENNQVIKCVKVNIDENQNVAANHQIMSVPTTILIKDGKVMDRKVGMKSKNELQEWVDKFNN
ncbi:MAG: thioredoxin [Rickettsiaceae bacterium H1]|nr:thioredoxin [Rickettsiaceae bacterium H1]